MTVAALFGFSTRTAFWQLCLRRALTAWARAAWMPPSQTMLALHYEPPHELAALHVGPGQRRAGHCGLGAGPQQLAERLPHVSVLVVLTAIIFSLPLWKTARRPARVKSPGRAISTLPQLMRVPGVPEVMAMFACYSVVETTAGMWASSYCTLQRGIDAGTAASWASLFYVGNHGGAVFKRFYRYETQRPPDDQPGVCAGGAGHLAHSAAAGQRCGW